MKTKSLTKKQWIILAVTAGICMFIGWLLPNLVLDLLLGGRTF